MFSRVLRTEVILLLCAKAAALTAIYFLFIAPHRVPEPDGPAVRLHILSQQTP